MGKYDRKDHYYRKAKKKGLPSRAFFKVEEILKKFPLVRPGDWVLDLGAAPGGWTVQLARTVGKNGRVLALDLKPLPKVQGPNILFLQEDIFTPPAKSWIEETLGAHQARAVFSDMSPKLSGIDFKDAYLSYELCLKGLDIARRHLQKGGGFVCKIFPGIEFQDFLKEIRKSFAKVKTFEPKSSRKTSREVYVVAMEFCG